MLYQELLSLLQFLYLVSSYFYITLYGYLVPHVTAVKCQECTDMVGSLDHNSNIVPFDSTYILSGYTLPCSGTVVAWEFCYRASNPPSVTFSPGIWRINYNNGDRNYMIVRSSDVTYTPVNINGTDSCLTFNLAVVDQFTAPAGSVVGLYSNLGPLLLHTDTDSSITTYQVNRNQSIVSSDNYRFVNYHIALRVHLGECSEGATVCVQIVTFKVFMVNWPSTKFSSLKFHWQNFAGYLVILKNKIAKMVEL